MDATKLFNAIRSLANEPLLQLQVDSVNAILNACTKYSVTDNRQIAYVLATAYHESRLKPIEEIGKGAGHPYGNPVNGHVYYGRGFCQLTWEANYKTFGNLLHADLLNQPELALQPDIAAEVIALGMQKGLFTGVGLGRYFNDTVTDPLNARRIINGTDCNLLIKGYYDHILAGILS